MPPVKEIYLWTTKVRPEVKDFWFSDKNFTELQSLVNSTGSVQFQDTWRRYRFNWACYIWNRTAINFNWTTMYTVNIDTLTATSKTISVNISDRPWYFWENRILTHRWLLDLNWNVITSFSYDSITPWLPWVVWANSGFNIYKWTVNGDSITFTSVGTWWTDQGSWSMYYWNLWAYLINVNDTKWSGYSSYINPSTNAITNFTWWANWRFPGSYAWCDGKLYRWTCRSNWWWRFQKIWTWDEWFVWDSLSTSWSLYGGRELHFLGNYVSWWMNSNNWTGNGYGSNSYFITTSWTLTKVQTNALAYDSSIGGVSWFVDENWWIYPGTSWGGTWVILKTDKTFSNFPRRNPYLWR